MIAAVKMYQPESSTASSHVAHPASNETPLRCPMRGQGTAGSLARRIPPCKLRSLDAGKLSSARDYGSAKSARAVA